MINETRKKILDAALEEFAENGYKGATIRVIAQKAGFTEMTLFRNFKNKKNLFSSVLIENNEKIMKEVPLIFVEKEFENSKDFLETLIRNLLNLGKNNFKFIKLTINESSRIPGNFVKEFVNSISEYMENNIQNEEIDYQIFAFNLLSFIFLLLSDYAYYSGDHEKAIEKFINNSVICIR